MYNLLHDLSLFTPLSGTWKSSKTRQAFGKVTIELPRHHMDAEGPFETVIKFEYCGKYREGTFSEFKLSGFEQGCEYTLASPIENVDQTFLISLKTIDHSKYNMCGDYTCVKPSDFGHLKLKYDVTCWGCIENQPNQQAHVDPGGCLYTPYL